MKTTKDFNGVKHTIEGIGWEDDYAEVIIDGYLVKRIKMGYRHERTWDDHMGNTYCGYYIDVKLKGCKRRVYADEIRLFGR